MFFANSTLYQSQNQNKDYYNSIVNNKHNNNNNVSNKERHNRSCMLYSTKKMVGSNLANFININNSN